MSRDIIEAATHAEFQDILDKYDSVVVDFTATWCGPCRSIAPVFHEYSIDTAYSNVAFVTVDVDENQETAAYCKVSSMPTFVAFFKGQEAMRFSGANKEKLKIMVDTSKAVLEV